MPRNGHFRWTENIKNPEVKTNVENLLQYTGEVAKFNREKAELEPTDYEGSREALRATMIDIYRSTYVNTEGTNQHNPLWDAMMMIRPKMLTKQLPKRFVGVINTELWEVSKAAQAEKNQKEADFFRDVAKQMPEWPIYIWRALIAGDRCVDREGKFHYFPGIPRDIQKEVGLALTIKPDNIQAHKAALKKLREREMVPENVGNALQSLAEDLYALLERRRVS